MPALPRCFLLIAAALVLVAAPLTATHYTVTIFDDNDTTNGNCSLREAIRAADTDAVVDACAAGSGADLITLPAGTVTFDGGEETVHGTHGALTIAGPTGDPASATVSCTSSNRFLSLSSAQVTLQGFTVTLCDSGTEEGGALDAVGSSLTLQDMVFASNHSAVKGGAVSYAWTGAGSGSLRIDGSEFTENSADSGALILDPYGGAVWALLYSSSSLTVTRSIFGANSLSSATRPSNGGGIYVSAIDDAQVTLRDVEFLENLCGEAATGHDGCGLAMDLADSAHVSVEDCTFEDNHHSGTSIYGVSEGADFRLENNATLLADRLRFDHNVSPIDTNDAKYQILVETYDASSAVVRNILTTRGFTGILGSASTGTAITIDHATSSDNEEGVRLYVETGATLGLQNSIVWGNSPDDLATYGTGSVTTASNHVGGEDPLFVNPVAGNYRLTSSSPDRDTGDETLDGVGSLDLDHAPRWAGIHADKGAYEYGGIFGDGYESGDTSAWSSAID